jgi:hypothetical protein
MSAIVQKNFFEDDYCDLISKKVISLKNYWKIPKYTSIPDSTLYQLGTVVCGVDTHTKDSVKHVPDSTESYDWRSSGFLSANEHKEKLKKVLDKTRDFDVQLIKDNFLGLDSVLTSKLSELLGKPCVFWDNGTYLGFQILQSNYEYPAYCTGRGWHYDDVGNFYRTMFIEEDIKGERGTHYSITLLISSPTWASFQYYDSYEKYPHHPSDRFSTPCKDHLGSYKPVCSNPVCPFEKGDFGDIKTVTLEKGSIIVQQERYMHRIGPSYLANNDDYRITIQLSGSEIDGIIYLFK